LRTKEEILEMKPGNDLDSLVAEKIIGYKITTGHTGEKYLDGFSISKIPSYSKDISAAWEVVKKMSLLSRLWLSGSCNKWYVLEIEHNEWGEPGRVLEDVIPGGCNSAPEAICKAALLMVLKREAK
jgi:hypothetical protein